MRRIQLLLNPNLVDVEIGPNMSRQEADGLNASAADTERRNRIASIYRIAPSP